MQIKTGYAISGILIVAALAAPAAADECEHFRDAYSIREAMRQAIAAPLADDRTFAGAFASDRMLRAAVERVIPTVTDEALRGILADVNSALAALASAQARTDKLSGDRFLLARKTHLSTEIDSARNKTNDAALLIIAIHCEPPRNERLQTSPARRLSAQNDHRSGGNGCASEDYVAESAASRPQVTENRHLRNIIGSATYYRLC